MFSGREFSKVVDSAYYAYIRKHQLEDTEELRTTCNRFFYFGAQYAMKTSGELSPHIARFMEFMMWLTGSEDE